MEKDYEKQKKILIGVISSIILLIIFIAASFAYFGMFTVNLENKMAVNIHADTTGGNASFIASSANLNVIVPISSMIKGNTGLAAENTASLTVNLTRAEGVLTTCTYDVVYEYDLDSDVYGSTIAVTSGATKEITMQVSVPNSATNNYNEETNFAYDSSWTPMTTTVGAKRTLVKGVTIRSTGASTVQTINVTGRYYNVDSDQSQLEDKSFTGTIYVENNKCSVGETANKLILKNNGGAEAIEAKGTPTFTTSATTNEGMYATKDDYGTSYYFRGAVDNNWLKFGQDSTGADIYWRIIRINGDGSIRMIYTGTATPTESQKVLMTGEETQIETSEFNSNSYGNSERVGYQSIIGQQHGYGKCNGTSCVVDGKTVHNSTIKKIVDTWYLGTTLKDNDLISQNQIFCNDRNLTSGTWASEPSSIFYHSAYTRLYLKKEPQLKCTTTSDKFTVNESNGNGALTYPVGLITADEMVMAGVSSSNSSYYLYTGKSYWSGSPGNIQKQTPYFYTRMFYMNSDKFDLSDGVYLNIGVRPVISISKDANLSGNGTWNNPYVVRS